MKSNPVLKKLSKLQALSKYQKHKLKLQEQEIGKEQLPVRVRNVSFNCQKSKITQKPWRLRKPTKICQVTAELHCISNRNKQ